MKDITSINSNLLKRAEEFAQAHATSVYEVIEEALGNYLGSQFPDSPARNGHAVKLPVATSLQMAPGICDLSFGKLLDLSDEGVSLDKAR